MAVNTRTSLWSVLRHRDLRLLFGGLLFSSMGSWAYNVALLAVMYQRTHSVGWVAAASLIRYLAGLLVTSYAGVLAERPERIRLMIRSDLLCCLWQAGLAAHRLEAESGLSSHLANSGHRPGSRRRGSGRRTSGSAANPSRLSPGAECGVNSRSGVH